MVEKSAGENRADFLYKSHGHIEVSSHLGSALPKREILTCTWRTEEQHMAWLGLHYLSVQGDCIHRAQAEENMSSDP